MIRIEVARRGSDPARRAWRVGSSREFRGATRVDPVEDVRHFIGAELFVNFLVHGIPENLLDLSISAMSELGGVDPRFLCDVELVLLLDGGLNL